MVAATKSRGSNKLITTGWVTGEDMVESIRCALAWARLHRHTIATMFLGEGGAVPSPADRTGDEVLRLLPVDLGRTDLDFYASLGNQSVRKYGSSVGPR